MAAVYKFRWDDGSKAAQKTTLEPLKRGTPCISGVETLWPVVRLHMANETTNGEEFLQTLTDIRNILETTVLNKNNQLEEALAGRGSQNALYALAIEYIPRLLSYMPRIKTNKPEMGVILLDIMCYLLATEQGSLFSFLVTFSSTLLHLPCPEWPQACHEIVSRLCHFVLPTCLLRPATIPLPPMSMSSTLMLVLEVCTARHHLLTADTLMFLKRDVCTDILSLVAYGTPTVAQNALKLLLHYWPPSTDFSRNVSPYGEWQTPECENPACRHGNVQASVLCLDAACVSQHKGQRDQAKLYMLLCHECHSIIHRSVADSDVSHPTLQIPQPLRDVRPNCEFQKMCSGKERQVNRAEVTCYDDHCTAIQGGQPIRMCPDCHSKQHDDIRNIRHIYQVGPPNPWMSDDPVSSSAMLEAVAKLLQSLPTLHKTSAAQATVGRSTPHTLLDVLQKIHTLPYQLKVEGSREGIWLLSHYCTPTSAVSAGQFDWLVHLSALALEWLRTFHDILKQVEEEIPASPNQDTDNPSPDVTEYLQYFSNYNDISRLVDPLLISWLCEVAKTNSDCLVEALHPHPRPCAQVGKLWEKDCDSILRYRNSLFSLHRLYQFFKSNHIPRVAFMKIYNSVMPEWLDLLVQLRMETGKMASLHIHYQRLITQPYPEGKEMIEFVWAKFRDSGASGVEMQKALFWLQDLTRLKIELPYIHHMFESALEQKSRRSSNEAKAKVSVASSFDEEVEERRHSMKRGRKGSTGSNVSDAESEPALLSESCLEEADALTIASLNSSLTRSILMLDIWLSQMKLGTHQLDYNMLKRLLVKMLQMSWGSRHSYTDHHDTTNSCLLCKATALWFSLATQLLEENEKRLLQLEEEEEEDGPGSSFTVDGSSSRTQHQRISMKKALKKLRKLTHGETNTSEDFQPSTTYPVHKFGTFPGKKGGKHDFRKMGSAGVDGSRGKSPQRGEEMTDFDREFPPAEVKSKLRKNPLRKMATVDTDGLQVVPELPEEDGGGEGEEEEEGENDVDDIQTIFHHCRDHLKPKLHPETLHKVVQCLTVLIRKSHVLQDMEESEATSEARNLFKDVWKCLGAQSSFVAQSCVGLMIDCLKFLSDYELPKGVDKSTGWIVFHSGLKTDKFKTVEKFCIFLEFMLSPETELDWNNRSSTVIGIQVTVAYSFCLAVQLLQDKTSSVASRASYCLGNLSISTLKALRKFIMRLFLDCPSYRTLTLHSLSLLNTTLPRHGVLTLDLLEHMVSSLAPSSTPLTGTSRQSGDHSTSKKESVASDYSGLTPRTSISSYIPSSPMAPMSNAEEESNLLQLALALLLNHIANPESDAEKSPKKAKLQRGVREASVELELRPVILSRLASLNQDPPSLRANPVFHIFLNHIYPVLDNNAEFSSTTALNFILNRLITCTAPTGEESFLQCLDQGAPREGRRCEFGLGVLPTDLRVPWLRVFYIILYKYVHNYQNLTQESHLDIIFLVRCCMEIALNTIEASPHTCPLLAPTGQTAPPFRRQRTAVSHPSSASQPTASDSHTHRPTEGERKRESSSLSPVQSPPPPHSSTITPPPHSSTITPAPHSTIISLSSAHKLVQSTASTASVDSVGSISSVFLRPHSVPKVHSGLCSVCGRVTNEFDEEVITHCAITIATCCHRLPTRVSGYLVSRVIPALSKVLNICSGSYTWQSSSDDQPPGSAAAVASNLLKSVATQFADRRLFIFLFNHQYETEVVAERVFAALCVSLPQQGEGEGEGTSESSGDMTVVSPLTYFLQDAVNSTNFTQDVRTLSLVHLALYVEKTTISLTSMLRTVNLLDSFCRKLKITNLLRDATSVHAFLRVVIHLLASIPETLPQSTVRSPSVHSFSQSLISCLEVIFNNVYCPVVGLFKLAGSWYKAFLASPRDANRLVQLYISELRRALKSNQTVHEVMHPGTFLSVTQVLLLEESGYLSYVDGLTEERVYAPQLRNQFEFGDIFLNTIQELQWDFVDALLFLDASPNHLPAQYVQELQQLKLLVGQLVALRVQHGRSPVEQLRRLITGDLRPITLPSKGAHQRATTVRWYDHLSALHILSWLLLGAMCHNAVHQVSSADKNTGLGGRCQLLGSLDANMEITTTRSVWLTRGAMRGIRRSSDNTGSQCQYLLFTFTAIWTYYMETWEQNSTAVIVQFWENFVSNMVDLLGDYNITDERHRINVLHNINDKIILPLKKCGLACFTMLLPIWRKLSNQLTAGHFQVFPIIPESLTTVTMDTWFKEMVTELVTVETESNPHIATTAL